MLDVHFTLLYPVQRVYAIGKPPEDQLCLFAHLKNVVVFSATGLSYLLAFCRGFVNIF